MLGAARWRRRREALDLSDDQATAPGGSLKPSSLYALDTRVATDGRDIYAFQVGNESRITNKS